MKYLESYQESYECLDRLFGGCLCFSFLREAGLSCRMVFQKAQASELG